MTGVRPIFILGAARSGTTMLGAILGSAKGCLATPESQFLTNLVAGASWPGGILYPDVARSGLARDYRFRIWGVAEDAIFSGLEAPIKLRCVLERLILAYSVQRGGGEVEVWVDHTPGSLFILPHLAEVFPDARFLHLVRDGRAVGASILPLDWGPVNIADAARRWSCEVAVGLAAETAPLVRGRIRRVYYESLVSEPLATVADLCNFCDLPFEESMTQGKGFLVPRYTRDQHSLVGSQPQIARVSSWKTRLSARQIEIFEADAGGLLQLLGYPTEFWPDAVGQTEYEAWSARLRKLLVRPYNFIRHRRRLQGHFQHVEISADGRQ